MNFSYNEIDNNEAVRLAEIFRAAGFSLSEDAVSRLLCFSSLLRERNKVMNLTAITGPDEIFVKHFLDSAYPLTLLPKGTFPAFDGAEGRISEKSGKTPENGQIRTMIDVGSGAGFPGLPVKIVCPGIKTVLLDALEKRTGFLREVISALELKDAEAVHARSEDAAAAGKPYREAFDMAVSRAVSQLPVLAEYCLPFVRTGGLFIAYKSVQAEEEIKSAEHAMDVLGGTVENVIPYTLPGTDFNRTLVVIRKERSTPNAYPRKAGKPEKKPL